MQHRDRDSSLLLCPSRKGAGHEAIAIVDFYCNYISVQTEVELLSTVHVAIPIHHTLWVAKDMGTSM